MIHSCQEKLETMLMDFFCSGGEEVTRSIMWKWEMTRILSTFFTFEVLLFMKSVQILELLSCVVPHSFFALVVYLPLN